MKTLIASILCLLLILLVIFLVLRKAETRSTEDRAKPVSYTYYLTISQDIQNKGMTLEDGKLLPHYYTYYAGDTLKFWTLDRCLLSENHNLINAVTGEVEYENVALVREVIQYE